MTAASLRSNSQVETVAFVPPSLSNGQPDETETMEANMTRPITTISNTLARVEADRNELIKAKQKLTEQLADDALDVTFQFIQKELGITDGGFAGQFYEANRTMLLGTFVQYIRQEIAQQETSNDE